MKKEKIKEEYIYKTKINIYRFMYIWFILVVPIYGFFYASLYPSFKYFLFFRVVSPCISLIILILSFRKDFARKYLDKATLCMIYFVSIWFLGTSFINQFPIDLTYGLLLTIVLLSNIFYSTRKLRIYILIISILACIGIMIAANIKMYRYLALFLFVTVPLSSYFMANRKIHVEKQITYLAHHDILTDLPNRRLGQQILQGAIDEAYKKNKLVGVMFIDLDEFKYINDILGHDEGDMLLQEISTKLKKCIRQEDKLIRLGGDEFMVVFKNIRSFEHLTPIGTRIISIFSTPFLLKKRYFHITCSIGLALYPDNGEDVNTLFKNADIAMYQAKEEGGNNFRFFDKALNDKITKNIEMKENIIEGIQRKEFIMHYQPKVEMKSGKINGSESLIRWNHPQRGLIYPNEFIPIAEEYGLIKHIDRLVLEMVCYQIKEWEDKGINPGGVSANISADQFSSPEFIEVIDATLKETGINPNFLSLEITETGAMKDTCHTKENFKKIKERGISIALDDFGIKYSSLNYLKAFPIDVLKIDKSFIDEILYSDVNKTIVLSTINIAKTLNIKVIAEGVEVKEQLHILKDFHCDEYQGYLYSKPVSPKEMEEMLIQNQAILGIN